jgi:hypothetical protein
MVSRRIEEAHTALQRTRLELGWKQSRAIAAMTARARESGIRIATPSSLKTMLSRWENGHGQPDAVYQRLLCDIYRQDGEELGFDVMSGAGAEARVAPVLDPVTVDYFRAVLEQHVRADNLMGPQHLINVVKAQAALLDDILPGARKDVRDDLLVLACRYNELVGWLHQDAGDPHQAMVHSDRAMDYALAIDRPSETAYLLMRKSNIASDLGNPDRALGLTVAAMRGASRVSPQIRALVLGQQARAHALRGDGGECARSLDAAMRAMAEQVTASERIAAYCTPAYVQMQAATCWAELRMPHRAIPVFEEALSSFPTFMRRDQGLCLTRLASAHAGAGDRGSACRVGRQAVRTVEAATSARSLWELRELRKRLAPWRRDTEVSDLSQEIKRLTRAA